MTGQGYVEFKEKITTGKTPVDVSEFEGKICLVMEFARDGGVLALNPKGTALGMFDKEDIFRSFKCTFVNSEIICAPGLNMVDQILYSTKVLNRNGGYSPLLKNLVIAGSLIKGEFDDSILWMKK